MHAKMSFRMTVIRYIIETKEPKAFTCPGIISLGTEWIFSVQGSLDFTHQPWNTHSCPSMQSTFRTSLSLNNINVTLLFRQKHFHNTKQTVSMKQEKPSAYCYCHFCIAFKRHEFLETDVRVISFQREKI